MQRAHVDQSPKDFLDEKRIAAGAVEDALSHRDRQLSVSLAEKGGKQLLPVGCNQRTKTLHGDAHTIGVQRVDLRCRPVDRKQHQPATLQPIHHEAQHLQRSGVRPMQILDDKQ